LGLEHVARRANLFSFPLLPSPFPFAILCGLLLGLLLASWPIESTAQADYGFRFVSIRYGDDGGDVRRRGFRGGAPWSHDWPTAEHNFYEALERTTKIHVDGEALVLTLKDDRIFEYPVLYLCEPGYWTMTEEEVENLREYLLRGGFLLFDDFRGDRELRNMIMEMKRVFPDKDPIEIPPDHAIWGIYYDIDPVEAPSNVSGGWQGGFTKFDDTYYALFDDNGRMMALANYNQDIGDGWEWPDQNFEDASTISFQMGINFVMYALTH